MGGKKWTRLLPSKITSYNHLITNIYTSLTSITILTDYLTVLGLHPHVGLVHATRAVPTTRLSIESCDGPYPSTCSLPSLQASAPFFCAVVNAGLMRCHLPTKSLASRDHACLMAIVALHHLPITLLPADRRTSFSRRLVLRPVTHAILQPRALLPITAANFSTRVPTEPCVQEWEIRCSIHRLRELSAILDRRERCEVEAPPGEARLADIMAHFCVRSASSKR